MLYGRAGQPRNVPERAIFGDIQSPATYKKLTRVSPAIIGILPCYVPRYPRITKPESNVLISGIPEPAAKYITLRGATEGAVKVCFPVGVLADSSSSGERVSKGASILLLVEWPNRVCRGVKLIEP